MAATITPETPCPVCGKRHRAGSKPLAACAAKLAAAQAATEAAPGATVPTKADASLYSHSMTGNANVGAYNRSMGNGANGLRLLLAARKSRKATSDDMTTMYERQDQRAEHWSDGKGHAIVARTADTKSGTSAPWERKQLKPWMTDPAKMALFDAILISDTDRLSRGTDEDFHWIENWCYRTGKSIIVADGPQFPPREGPMGDSDRYQWIAQKRAARTYWEATRDKHADTREIIKANGGAIGKPPFGYRITGAKLHKTFTIDLVTGPLAKEAFQRIADGRTATSVAIWLTEATGKMWRVKRVIDMIKRRSYLGERDGHVYEALIPQALWESANAVISGRYVARGGRRTVHAYSGVIYCPCGACLYRHQSTRNGQPAGTEKYLCSRGRQNLAGEAKCGNAPISFAEANAAVDAEMRADGSWPWVTVTTGGDAARQSELAKIKADMNAAIANGDMGTVGTLAGKYAEIDARPAEPIVTKTTRRLDKSVGELWAEATLTDQRAMLGASRVIVNLGPEGTVTARYDLDEDGQFMAA
ncbi:MAG TPA: recombinase family protein [Trebonia sp.]|nr:recombinase family protein [Trebonia sp.]